MKKIIFFLLSLICVASFAQTTTEISNILAGQYASVTGNITTQNLVPAGTATAGSAVALTLANQSSATIHVSGTYTGALSLQYSTDLGTTWVTVSSATQLLMKTTGVPAATIASASVGAWTTDVAGLTNIRVTGLAAMTGTAVVTIRAVWGSQQVGINIPLPTGANVIGALTANQSTNLAQVGGTSTVNGGVAGILAVGGNIAHSAASTANPLQVSGRVVPTTAATTDATLVPSDVAYVPLSTGSQAIQKPFGTAELDYNYNLSSVATTVTVQQIAPASGTANIRNYITSLTYQSDAIGAAGTAWVLDGQGAIGTSVTIATPGVFTSATHDLKVGDAIVFTSLGTITGVTTNTVYYITATSFAATTFTVATTQGGTALQITGSTAAFTFYRVLHQVRFQTTAIGGFAQITFPNPIRCMANVATNFLIPTSLTSGNIYLTANGYRGF